MSKIRAARLLGCLIALLLMISACTPAAPTHQTTAAEPTSKAVTLNVMAAASLTGVFTELGVQFEAANPGVKVQFNFAASQQLAQQLGQGAPADVFASANKKQMDVAVEVGRVAKDTSQIFVTNKLVVIYPNSNPAGLQSLEDLAIPGLKLVFAAKEVPVGQYSLDFLDKAAAEGSYGTDYQEKVLENVVSYETNVKAVLTKIAIDEADAGIVYSSDVTGADAEKVGQIAIPDTLNVIAKYPIAVIKDSNHKDLAQKFVDLVLSDEGQSVLAKYGFVPGASR